MLGATWARYRWEVDRFRRYLDGRLKLHGHAFSSDELEYAGFFILHGSLSWLTPTEKDGQKVVNQLNPHYSDIFDQLYRHWTYGLREPKLNVGPPVNMDFRASLLKGEPVIMELEKVDATGVGRNDPCPCGSGTKFKNCHGSSRPQRRK